MEMQSGKYCKLIVVQTSDPGKQGAPRDPSDTFKIRGQFYTGRDVLVRLHAHLNADYLKVEVWDESTGFTLLEDDMCLQGISAAQILVHLPIEATEQATLAIEGRAFDDSNIWIAGKRLVVQSISNSSTGTGHNTWDGAMVLAKYIELNPSLVEGKRVLELGAGTGLAGIAAAVLGASATVLTDLAYVIDNLRANIHANDVSGAEAAELDWMKVEEFDHLIKQQHWDVLLCADVVWLEQLVQPLVQTLHTICSTDPKPQILMSYQKRSDLVHDALMFQLTAHGFAITEVDISHHHPVYSSPKIAIYEMRCQPGLSTTVLSQT